MAGWRARAAPTPLAPNFPNCAAIGTPAASQEQPRRVLRRATTARSISVSQKPRERHKPQRPFPGTHSAQLPPPVFAFHIFHFPHTFLFNPILAMKKVAAEGAGFGLSAQQKGRSEEHIHSAKFPAEAVKKALKEKSQSQTAIRVGPFAAIREAECEKRRQKNGSLDIMDESANSAADDGAALGERATTVNGATTGIKPVNGRNK